MLPSLSLNALTTMVLFVASTFGMVALTRSALRKGSMVNKQYVSTLTEMFKATKTPNERHKSPNAGNVTEIFNARCNFFRRVLQEANLHDVKFIHVAGTKGKGK